MDHFTKLIFDADGVLLDSFSIAATVAEDLLAVLGRRVNIADTEAYAAHFGRAVLDQTFGLEQSAWIRRMHALAMRERACEVRVFEAVLGLAVRIHTPRLIVTSAFAAGVNRALGHHGTHFDQILGKENGRKPEVLAVQDRAGAVYVTDTPRDIEICRALGLPVIAVSWGYTSLPRLQAAAPTFIANNINELETLFTALGLLAPTPATKEHSHAGE